MTEDHGSEDHESDGHDGEDGGSPAAEAHSGLLRALPERRAPALEAPSARIRPTPRPRPADEARGAEAHSGLLRPVARPRAPAAEPAPEPARPALRAGDRLGRWTLNLPLGAGAFGATWAATDELGREAAIKLLETAPGDEVRALGSLCHPAIPALFEAQGWPQPYIAMERASGRGLDTMVRAGAAPETAALRVIAVLMDALALVHQRGLAHGDIKPENIIVERISDQRVWLVDFGMVGGLGGTLHYAAPERVRGEPPSGPADVYAAGVVLYEMLHGQLPWAEEGLAASLARRRTEAPPATAGAPWLRALLGELLAPEPGLRPTAAAVVDVLEAKGVPLPRIDGPTLRRRARAAHLPRPGLDEAARGWLQRGGLLQLLGAPGTGRSHALDRLSLELQARGRPHLRLCGGGLPWAGVAGLLADPALPGPAQPLPACDDPRDRVDQAAAALLRRAPDGLIVLVDDPAGLPAPDAELLRQLVSRRGVRIAAAGPLVEGAPSLPLSPLSIPEIDALIGQLLVGRAPAGLAEALAGPSGGLPGACVDLVARAADAGALSRRSGLWVVEIDALQAVIDARSREGGAAVDRLAPALAEPLVALALLGAPCPADELARLLPSGAGGLSQRLRALVEAGHLRVDDAGWLHLAAPAAVRGLALRAPPAAHAAVALALQARGDWQRDPVAALRLADRLCGAEDGALIDALGPALLLAARGGDAAAACAAAAQLWALRPTPALAPQVVRLLSAGGRAPEARALGEAVQAAGEGTAALALELARAAVDAARDGAGALAQLAHLAAADPTLAGGLEARALAVGARALLGEHDVVCALTDDLGHFAPPDEDAAALDAYLDLLRVRVRALCALGRPAEAEPLLERLPPSLGRGRPARGLVEAARGLVAYKLGRLREAAKIYEAVAGDDAGLPLPLRAQLVNNAAVISYQSGDRSSAISRWEAALLRFERLGDAREQARVRSNLCLAYTESGRWERARAAGEAAHAAAKALPDWGIAATAAGNLGDLCAAQGQAAQAHTWYELTGQIAEQHGLDGERVELARRRAELAVQTHDPQAAGLCAAAMDLANQAGEEVEAALSRALGLLCRAREEGAGRGRTLLDEIDAIIEHLSGAGHPTVLARARLIGAEALLAAGLHDQAARAIEAAGAWATESGHQPLKLQTEKLRQIAKKVSRQDSRTARFERAMTLTAAVTRAREPEALLDAVGSAARQMLEAERSFVLLTTPGSSRPRVVRAEGVDDAVGGEPSWTIVEQVCDHLRPVIAGNIFERGDLRERKSVAALALRSAVCVPMLEGDALLGVIYVDSRRQGEEELAELAGMLSSLADHAAIAISHARATAALAARGRRAAELAHDIRSPLGSATTLLAELREEAAARGERGVRLAELQDLVDRAAAMARRMLEDKPEERQGVDLGRLVAETCAPLARDARRAGQSLRVEAPPGVTVLAVPAELSRLLTNLIGNALRYNRIGGEISVVVDEEQSGGLLLHVADEGPGVPEELLGRLFEWGVKDKGPSGGYGYGLSIVSTLVSGLGGAISVQNRPEAEGGGARFTVRLPAALRLEGRATA